MTAMHTVEYELLTKLGESSKYQEENREDYLKRITISVAYVKDDTWASLSEDAKLWANNSIDLLNEGDTPEDFYEFFGTQEDEEFQRQLEESYQKVEEEKNRAPNKKHDPRRNKKRGRKPTKKPKGAGQRAKELFLENPTYTMDEILSQLILEGHTMSRATLIAVRAEFRNSLKVLYYKGFLPKDYYYGFPIDNEDNE